MSDASTDREQSAPRLDRAFWDERWSEVLTVDAAVAVLDPRRWEIPIAEDRPRAAAGTGFDAVICARRRT